MCLSNVEVVTSFKQAKNKKLQITILSELTNLSKHEILEILQNANIDVSTYVSNKKFKTVREHRFDTDKAYELYKEGKGDSTIAKIVGVSFSTIADWRHTNNYPANLPEKYTKNFDNVIELHKNGLNTSDIAKKLNISYGIVRKIKKAAQLEL